MGTVSDLLRVKGHDVHTIESGASVLDAVRRMVDRNVGSLLVLDGEEIAGIITERDYLREIVLKGRTSRETPVEAIMTKKVIVVRPEDTVEACMAIMTERRIRHLPVLREGAVDGLISIGDLVRQLSQDQKAEIRYLTDYITGRYPG
ncbi:MAG TPA: CBS domain-containing protein [Candidatus Eisenbacteria bacterium]|nr:CBS domain-containing protein [Candidatus Eisenbacteria bacterium]